MKGLWVCEGCEGCVRGVRGVCDRCVTGVKGEVSSCDGRRHPPALKFPEADAAGTEVWGAWCG